MCIYLYFLEEFQHDFAAADHSDQAAENVEQKLNCALKNVRGTSSFWQNQYHNLNAMDAVFGPPTWFLTLSCAEYGWADMDKVEM